VRPDNRTIVDALSDDEVLDLILAELNARLPVALQDDPDTYVHTLEGLPDGLRAMAATYQLDVSLTLDDLGWHFGNWHHHGYSLETARGLRVLGASRAEELFDEAYHHARQYWERLDQDDWMQWYHGSPLEQAVAPLTNEISHLLEDGKVMGLWVRYGREHPGLLDE